MKRVTEVSPYYGKYPETLEIEEYVLTEDGEYIGEYDREWWI